MNTLSENNINIEIGTTVRLDCSINDYPNLKQKLIDDWYSTEYYLSYDGYNYNWETKYRGEEQ